VRNSVHISDREHNPGDPNRFPEGHRQPHPYRLVLTRPVVLTISTYAILAFLEICNFALVPLMYTTPIEFGGLGLDPAQMATCLAAYGIVAGILPFFFFHRIVGSLGLRRSLLTFISGLVPAFLFFPINGTRAQHAGVDDVAWILVFVHMLVLVGVDMAYGMIDPSLASVMPSEHL